MRFTTLGEDVAALLDHLGLPTAEVPQIVARFLADPLGGQT